MLFRRKGKKENREYQDYVDLKVYQAMMVYLALKVTQDSQALVAPEFKDQKEMLGDRE